MGREVGGGVEEEAGEERRGEEGRGENLFVCILVGLVCRHDYTKTTEPIPTRISLCPLYTPLTFGADPGIFSQFL